LTAGVSDRKSLQIAVGGERRASDHERAADNRSISEETMKTRAVIASAALLLGGCVVVPAGPPAAVYVAPAPRVAVATPS
jgi:hypothetical protein